MSLQLKNQTGQLAEAWCKKILPLCVMKSYAGYYIGTVNEDGMPCSRESNEYFRSEANAQDALDTGSWTQKMTP